MKVARKSANSTQRILKKRSVAKNGNQKSQFNNLRTKFKSKHLFQEKKKTRETMNKKFTTPKNKSTKKRVCESAEQVNIKVRVRVRVTDRVTVRVRVRISELLIFF
jgi:hypothetical protein